MDSGYAVPDPTILRATIRPFQSNSATPHPESIVNLVRQPVLPMAGNNLHALSGQLYEAGSRMKGTEDMGSIFSRAAAHLYMKTQLAMHAEMSQYASPSTCDLRSSCQQVVSTPCTTPLLSHDTMEIMSTAPTSNSSSSFYNMMIPSKVYPQSMLPEQETLEAYQPENVNAYSRICPTYFSDIMLQAMETLEAGTSRSISLNDSLLTPSTPSHDPKSSTAKGAGVSGSNNIYQSFPATTHLDLLQEPLHNVPESPNSPSKQDSSVMSADDSDADRKLPSVNISAKKRNSGHRKALQKKIVYVPFSENKQRGEAPPADTWAWRKYGQKPIKGSPFPRGYYRCSSSKGCPARKQVERSSNNPSMVMVTYTADHNHPWPMNKNSNSSKAGNQEPTVPGNNVEDTMSSQNESNKAENLFSSIIDSPINGVGEQVVSSMEPLEDEESLLLQRDMDLCLSRTSTEGDDVFDNLGELPELSAIFSMKGYIMEESLDEDKFEQAEFL